MTWLHLIFDALCIAASVSMVQGARAPLRDEGTWGEGTWDEGTRAAAIAVLILCVAIGALRLTVRLGAARAPD